jgi:hypothetical protein
LRRWGFFPPSRRGKHHGCCRCNQERFHQQVPYSTEGRRQACRPAKCRQEPSRLEGFPQGLFLQEGFRQVTSRREACLRAVCRPGVCLPGACLQVRSRQEACLPSGYYQGPSMV